MKTPYDTAVRVQQRGVDDMRLAISAETGRLTQVEASRQAIEAAILHEGTAASEDPMMSTFAYRSRMQAQRLRLEADKALIRQRLDSLRDQAAAAYGSLRAIESAADTYRQDESRAAANAEQARVDDFASAAFLRARHRRTSRRDGVA